MVDPMHNLFLGLTKYHFREVVGIAYGNVHRETERSKKKKKGFQGHGISAKTISKILEVLKDPAAATPGRLKKFTINDLYNFHVCQRIPLIPQGDSRGKDVLVSSLLVCISHFIIFV